MAEPNEKTTRYSDHELEPIRNSNDAMADIIGDIGKWQVQKIILVFLISVPGLALMFSVPFVFYKTDFWCEESAILNMSSYQASLNEYSEGVASSKNTSLSVVPLNNTVNTCSMICTKYGYDRPVWAQTIQMEWNLVCDRVHLEVLAKMTIFGGLAVGTFGAGWISDNYGRKNAIVLMSQLLFGSGILASTMTNFIAFLILWFLAGIAAIGVYTVCFVWTVESVSGKWKTIIGIMMAIAFPVSNFLVTGIAVSFRDWRRILQVTSALHILTPLLASYFPESPRWLLSSIHSHHRLEAKAILKNVASVNGTNNEKLDRNIDNLLELFNDHQKTKHQATSRFSDIFTKRILLKRTVIMYWNWFTNAFIIYGFGLNWKELTGNLTINIVIGASLAILARFITMPIILKAGRKIPYIICLTGAGASFLIMLAFEKGVYPYNWPIVVFAMFGYFCIATTFGIIWIYASELYPTKTRNAAVGSCSFVARVGGVLATLVGQLAEIHIAIPSALFAFSALLSVLLTLLLPETGGKKLPDTIEECRLQSTGGIQRPHIVLDRKSKSYTVNNSKLTEI